jgi:hypothetical protein
MTREEIIKGLGKIGDFFRARADMAVGDGKMMLLNWMKCAEETAEAMTVRVMTLEEVMARRGEPAWLEAKSSKSYKGYVLIYDVQEGMGITGVRIGVTKPGHITIWPAKELYGVKWRCWTAKPTEAQIEAEPWLSTK